MCLSSPSKPKTPAQAPSPAAQGADDLLLGLGIGNARGQQGGRSALKIGGGRGRSDSALSGSPGEGRRPPRRPRPIGGGGGGGGNRPGRGRPGGSSGSGGGGEGGPRKILRVLGKGALRKLNRQRST